MPMAPTRAGSLTVSLSHLNEVRPNLLGSAQNKILYKLEAPGHSPLQGMVGPFTTSASSGTFAFQIQLSLGVSRLMSLQLNDAPSGTPLALGAVLIDLSPSAPGAVTIDLGSVARACYTVDGTFAPALSYGFANDNLLGAVAGAAPYDIALVGATSTLLDVAGGGVAFLGNGNLVDFDSVPATFVPSYSPLATGDIFCVKLIGGGHAWLQITDPGGASQAPSFRFRVNTTLPYYAYERTAADLGSGGLCGFVTATPTDSPTPSSTLSLTQTFTPTPSPTITVTPTFSSTRTLTLTPSSTDTAVPSATATASATSSPTSTSSGTPTSTATSTSSMTPTASLTVTRTSTSSITSTGTASRTETSTPTSTDTLLFTATSTFSVTPTSTGSSTFTLTSTPSSTGTASASSTPTSSPSSTPTATASPTVTQTPSATASSTRSDTPTPSWTGTQPPTDTPTGTSTLTGSPTATPTGTSTSSSTPTSSPTGTSSASSTASPTSTNTATQTGTPTATPSASPTGTSTLTQSPTGTPTGTSSLTQTPTGTPTGTSTLTQSPTNTPTGTSTLTQSPTGTPTGTSTLTQSPTGTATGTLTLTQTPTGTPTGTSTLTASPTGTPTGTSTLTQSPTGTPTGTSTLTQSPTATPTGTSTLTASPTGTPTGTSTLTQTTTGTPTGTSTLTVSPTGTATLTASRTPTVTNTRTITATPTNTSTPYFNEQANGKFPSRGHHTNADFLNKMWVMGGWDGSGGVFSDVYDSVDGRNWALAPAPMPSKLYGHTSLVFNDGQGDNVWVLAGNDGSSPSNKTYKFNGDSWIGPQVGEFPARYFHASVSFDPNAKNNPVMWVIGGLDSASKALGDVWSSSLDGKSWTLVSNDKFPQRAGMAVVVFQGQMLMMGGFDPSGGSTIVYDDILASPDGLAWNTVKPSAPFGKRYGMTAIVDSVDNGIWLIGGTDGSQVFNDAWRSPDGASWTQVPNATDPITSDERFGHSCMLFDPNFKNNPFIWVIGGFKKTPSGNPLGDVWSSP